MVKNTTVVKVVNWVMPKAVEEEEEEERAKEMEAVEMRERVVMVFAEERVAGIMVKVVVKDSLHYYHM